MRLHFSLTPNKETVPFDYQDFLIGAFHKWMKWNKENLKKLGLNNRQIKAVIYVKENGKITNKIYQETCDTSNRTATRDLSELVSLEIFKLIGTTGKGTEYILRRQRRHRSCGYFMN